MQSISESVVKKDHEEKIRGDAKYIGDLNFEDMVYGVIVRSKRSHARILQIEIPELEDGYSIIGYKDVPGVNLLKVITSEQPIFAEEEVRFVGEAILLVTGPDKEEVEKIVDTIVIEYEDLPAVYDIDAATDIAAQYSYSKGDKETAFKSGKKIITETFYTGYQEQAYIEPQGAIGLYEDHKVTIYGSMQCPYYVKDAVVEALGCEKEQVQIIQATTGGGFGGKEDYPSLLGCQVAVAAWTLKRPVKLILNRREDMAVTTKRHPAKLVYKASIDDSDKITAMDIHIKLDGGAYAGLSSVVLQRSLIAATGVYHIPNLKVEGQVMLTNTVPTGAYRGFGAPQSFYAIESIMNHIAKTLNLSPLEFKRKHFVKKGEETATKGQFHHPVLLPEMLEKIEVMSNYSTKYECYQRQTGRYRKGIGMSLFLHGCGFTGSAEKDFIRSVVKLTKDENDMIEILASNTDIGQGLKTTFSKIVAKVLEIPMEQIKIVNPDTDRVPNSGPTVASRSLMIVGKLLERAAGKLKEQWKRGEYQEIEEHYQHPYMIPWDMKTFTGDAYPTYSWGINVVEVEVDTCLATTKLLGVWGVYDVGTVIDETIMKGQMEGGMLQGLGYGSMEKMEQVKGVIKQASMTDYIIPTAMDTVPFETAVVDNPYEEGPFGAKGAGELTLIGAAPAYAAAVEEAIGTNLYQIPITPERLMEAM